MSEEKKNNGCLVLIIIIVIGLGMMWVFIPNNTTSVKHNKNLAYLSSQDFVKNKLKSPGTAVFPGALTYENHVSFDGVKYTINSYVDSENGFGALIRTRFSCEIKFDGNKVICNNLKFE